MSKWVRTQDLVWLLLFTAIAVISPIQEPPQLMLVALSGVLQLAEPRVPYFATPTGAWVAISIKLLLCYLLIGYTDGINSSYYPILLLPVVSAATSLGVFGTVAFTILACASYLSFLLFFDWSDWARYVVEWRELLLRVIFLPMVGYLTYTLAESNRAEARKSQETATQLAAANASLKEAEAAVRRSERLAALGQLTAGHAHELRNPMGTIRASAEMLKNNIGEDGVAGELAGFITSEVDRANSLVTRFLEFAKPVRLRLEKTEVSAVLDRAVAQLGGQPVAIFKNYSPDIHPVELDGELMERVFFNLLQNAAQASPDGAAVTIKTRQQGDWVEVAVIDRGAGIAKEQLENIFNPFFTTKKDGVGLGLAIVSKIVDEHGGRITVESEPGKGSVFHVLLPANRPGEAGSSEYK